MLDTYFSGSTNRVSPEAPVPILNLKKVVSLPGGAANVANNIKTLGADVLLMGIIGKDEGGRRLKDLLVKERLNSSFGKLINTQQPKKQDICLKINNYFE